jgi:hypothetical protein
MFGVLVQGTQFSRCVYDRLNKDWVSKIALVFNDNSFNFDPIYETEKRLKKYLIPAIIEGSSRKIELHQNA